MKVSELRVGNYIFSIETQEVQKITLVSEDNWISFNAITFDNPSLDEIEPISLTEEWLLKFGFEKVCHGRFTHKTSLFTLKLGLKREGYPYILCHYKNYPKPCNNVHQLQNLYFALTGEELKLNKN